MKTSRHVHFGIASAVLLAALVFHPRLEALQSAQPSPGAQHASSDAPRVIDTEQLLGEFTIGAHRFTVLAHEKSLTGASDAKFGATLGELEIRGAHGTVVYHKSFPFTQQGGRFAHVLSASASAFTGAGGSLLAIRYLEEPASPSEAESWQVFGLVNDNLTPFGVPLPPGQTDNLAVGNVLTGVMVGGGVNVMPLASKAEALEFRAWSGNFFVYVPVRVDWQHGQWGEGQQCFANNNGTLQKTGCNMRVEVAPQPPSAQGLAVRLYASPVEDPYNVQQIPMEAGTRFDILEARAVVNWKDTGDRISCSFEDMWLRVRFHGDIGWIHSETDFAAMGLPQMYPPQ
jgi:hypothetical protein